MILTLLQIAEGVRLGWSPGRGVPQLRSRLVRVASLALFSFSQGVRNVSEALLPTFEEHANVVLAKVPLKATIAK